MYNAGNSRPLFHVTYGPSDPYPTYTRLCHLSQIYFKNQQAAPGQSHPLHLPLSDVLSIVIDSFTGATERHIEVRAYCASFHPTF